MKREKFIGHKCEICGKELLYFYGDVFNRSECCRKEMKLISVEY